MPAVLADNVVSFLDAAKLPRGRAVKPESVGVINDCRDLAVKRICALLSSTFNKIEDELFALAEASRDRESQNLYLDARAQAREKRSEIESSFRKQFVSFFQQKVEGENAPQKSASAQLELSLVENEALDEDIAIADMARRLSDKCNEELRDLSQRMGYLLSDPDLDDDANPVSPDTVVKALKAACDQLCAGFQTKLTLMRLVEQHMANDMLAIYRDLNSHLVAHQVLPQIRPSYRRAAQASPRRAASSSQNAPETPTQSGVSASGAGSAASAASVARTPAQDVFAMLQSLMSGTPLDAALGASIPSAHISGAGAPLGVTTGSFAPLPPGSLAPGAHIDAELDRLLSASLGVTPPTPAPTPTQSLLSSLSSMQRQVTATGDAPSVLPTIPAFVPGETDVASLNVLRSVKSQHVAQTASQVDAMTIDIVAMLFDYIFDDKAIPDTIKALLARLQIPILKVAILDKSFFAKKAHPARKLLDRLADASVAFAGEANHDDPLYICIEHIVDRVQREFETEVALFATVLGTLEEFIARREQSNVELIERSARAMHEREKAEMARLIARDEIERRIAANGELPESVAAMLRGPWARNIERAYLAEGGRNQRFTDTLLVADDLLWSVAPKASAEERRRLVSILPPLLKRLQQGLEAVEIEAEDRQRFFASLVDCHAAAVKAGLRGESVKALLDAATSAETRAAAPLFAKLLTEEAMRAEAAKKVKRNGLARIHFGDAGVEIEELDNAACNASTSFVRPLDIEDSGDEGNAANAAEPEGGTALSTKPLKRGTWVEFLHNGREKIRAKLSWVSPLQGVYLFTNPGAHEALQIAPDALEAQLRAGHARVLEESSLIDRAVDKMVHSLAAAAH